MKIKSAKIIFPIMLILFAFPLIGGVEYNIPFVKQNGLLLIQAELNHSKAWFVFDSGADYILIHSKDQEETDKDSAFASLDGLSESSLINIEHIKIGELSKQNLEAYQTDLSLVGQFLGKEIKGILNAGFFNPQSLAIDLVNNTLRLYDEVDESILNRYANQLDFNTDLGVPIVTMQYRDQDHRFILDSGATANLISKSVLRKAEVSDVINDGIANMTTVGKQTECLQVKMKNWAIGDQSYPLQTFVVKDFDYINQDLSDKEKIAGLISLETLSKEGIFIDLQDMKIYF